MSFKGVEALPPQLAIRLKPLGDLGKRLGTDPVDPPLGLVPDRDQAGLPKYPKMLRDAGLAQLQALDQLADGALPVQQQIEDPTPGRLGEDVEGGRCSHGESSITI
jgi:hypothetical protein